MRYYIRADLKVKLERSLLLPGSFDFQIGAILADEATGGLFNAYKPLHQIDSRVLNASPKGYPTIRT